MVRYTEISEDFKNSPHFKRIHDKFQVGTISISEMKMYDPTLTAFLTCRSVKLDIVGDGFEITDSEIVDGTIYIDFYAEGYKSGIDFLIKNYIPSADVLYGPNNRIESIWYQHHGRLLGSWAQWYGTMLMTVSQEQITEFGYYAGILSELGRLADQHKPLKDAIEIPPRQRYPHRAEKYRPGLFKPERVLDKVKEHAPNPEQINTSEENLFNNMALEDVRVYFNQLATETSKNGRPFLESVEVEKFIMRAFLGYSDIPKLTLKFSRGEQQFIWSLFYNYFNICTTTYLYEDNARCKDKYIDLLSKNFTNFERKKIADNFNTTTSRKWPLTK